MNTLSQALSCPVSSPTGAEGELYPSYCPIIYCPSTENSGGNYTASVCLKYTDFYNSRLNYKKSCFTEVCGFNCDFFKSKEAAEYINKMRSEYMGEGLNLTLSVGCLNGDFRDVENQTTVFPNASIETFQHVFKAEDLGYSSSVHLEPTLFMPFFMLFIILLTSTFTKRISL